MNCTILQFIIVCPMVFLAGFVDAIAGGGGLISLPAYLIAGVPTHMALGTNKMSSMMGTAIATGRFAKNGYIQFKKVVWFIVAALIGSSIGSNLTLLVSDKILQYMMIVILPIVAFYVMRNKKMGDDSMAGTLPERKSFLIALASALIIGIYDGFYGPGTGTFLLLVLTGAARYTCLLYTSVKLRSPARLRRRWVANMSASAWAACATRRRSAVTERPTSARCRDASWKGSSRQGLPIR